jgi:alpha-beta hydrolase superfamily lysophospholipase
MKYAPFEFSSKDGLSLQGRAWVSEKIQPKGILYLLHDLGGHAARFAHVGERIADSGYHFLSFDMRGHGLSDGKRGHAPGYTYLMSDIEQLMHKSEEILNVSCIPKILYGHSFGGNLALNYVLRRHPDLAGVIVTSPMLSSMKKITKVKRALMQTIVKVFPTLKTHTHIRGEMLSRDLAFVKAYQDDVYIHQNISVRLLLDILNTGEYALTNAYQWDLPLLLMHGTADQITPASASKTFAESAGEMVDLVLWEGFYHELHNDLNHNIIINKIIAWMEKEI